VPSQTFQGLLDAQTRSDDQPLFGITMAQDSGSIIQLRSKVLRRLYEPLVLLNALGPVRGERIKKSLEPDITEVNHAKARRSFADGIAYISAYDKTPDLVTAAALEKAPSGVIVWLAANADIKPEVRTFVQGILDKLNDVAIQPTAIARSDRGKELYDTILTDTVNFNKARLRVYDDKIKKLTSLCFPTGHNLSKTGGQSSLSLSFCSEYLVS
jgi:hypothetical protein